MDEVIALIEKIQSLKERLPEFIKEAFMELAPQVEDAVIAQLAAGQRGDGTFLPDYSLTSVVTFGKTPGPMTLHDQGDFWRGITLVVHDTYIEITGLDIKTDMLVLRYGEEILLLSEESIENLKNDYLVELLMNKIDNYLLR